MITGSEATIEAKRAPQPQLDPLVIENLIDHARSQNAFGLLMSLNMPIEFGDAFDYTGADFAGWCKDIGFRDIEIVPLTGPASVGIAHK